MFCARIDLVLEVLLIKVRFNGFYEFLQEPLALAFLFLYVRGDSVVFLPVEVFEGKVLEFALQYRKPEPVSKGRVDVESFLSHTQLPRARKKFECSQVVKPVRELDEHNSQVGCHREKHLLVRLNLLEFVIFSESFNLRSAVHNFSDRIAELRFDVLNGELGVFYNVVKKRGCNRGVVNRDFFRENESNLIRMREIRFA